MYCLGNIIIYYVLLEGAPYLRDPCILTAPEQQLTFCSLKYILHYSIYNTHVVNGDVCTYTL